MNGRELREILLRKWGRSYAIQLRPVRDKIYFQVMWKYLEQVSFPQSEVSYIEDLDTIVNYLLSWGILWQVLEYLEKTKEVPRVGKAISLPLDLGEISTEWIVDPY